MFSARRPRVRIRSSSGSGSLGDSSAGATSLLAARGAEHATVRKVAAEAGLSPGAVQHHFRTLDDLITAAYGRTAERFRADLEEAVAEIDDPAGRFRAACHLLAGCADDSDRAREEAALLLAMLDGIAVARLAEPERMTAARGRDLIDRQLARLAADGDYAGGR